MSASATQGGHTSFDLVHSVIQWRHRFWCSCGHLPFTMMQAVQKESSALVTELLLSYLLIDFKIPL